MNSSYYIISYYMSLFIDKYRPTRFDEIKYGKDANQRLISLSKKRNMPHLILRGSYGSGKQTRVMLFLKEKFGPSVFKLKNHTIEACVPNKKDPIPLQILVSPYHYQFNPSSHGVYDRVLIQKFIDEIVKYKIVANIPYRIIVIENADLLTNEAQESLRRTLETRIKNCRFIFLINQVGNVIDPIQSRCIIINVPAPTNKQIVDVLQQIVIEEGHTSTNPSLLNKIAIQSERNMSTAIHNLQKVIIQDKNSLVTDQLALNDDVYTADQVILMLIKGTDLTIFNEIRDNIKKLFIQNIPATKILNMLFKRTLVHIPSSETEVIYKVCKFASDYDNTIRLGGKFIYHIEAFCLNVFKEIKMLMKRKKLASKAPILSRSNTKIVKSHKKITPIVKVPSSKRRKPAVNKRD